MGQVMLALSDLDSLQAIYCDILDGSDRNFRIWWVYKLRSNFGVGVKCGCVRTSVCFLQEVIASFRLFCLINHIMILL